MTSYSIESAIPTVSGESQSGELCLYQRHSCSRPRYQKFEYCVDHILEDKSSPFTSCEYLSRTSGRKCPNPALRSKKSNALPALCEEHLGDLIAKEQNQKRRKKLRKKRKTGKLQESASTISKRQKLIEHVAKIGQYQPKTSVQDSSDSDDEIVHRPITDNWALETSENLTNNTDWDDFDPVNNEVYEPLRYADVLTPEEVVATAQSKLIRLQSLYIEQFKRLFHILKEKRRQYLLERKKEIKAEKTTGGLNVDAAEESFDEEEIIALANYRRRTGVEALLRKRQQRRRLESGAGLPEYSGKPQTVQSRCSHASNHMRCKSSCLPYTKYCASHIMEDPHQLLYKKCHTELCPNALCYLTSRPYQAELNGDQSELTDVCYCSVHAPLPEMTFKFPDERSEDASMEIDINELPVAMAVETESSQGDKAEVDNTMQVDIMPLPAETVVGELKSSNPELKSNDAGLDSVIPENSPTQRPIGIMSSAVEQTEIPNGSLRSVDNETESLNIIDLIEPDGDEEKFVLQTISSRCHRCPAADIIDLTDDSVNDCEAPGHSTKKDFNNVEVKEHAFDTDYEKVELLDERIGGKNIAGSIVEEKPPVSTLETSLEKREEEPMDILASRDKPDIANTIQEKSTSSSVIDLTDDGKGCEILTGVQNAGTKAAEDEIIDVSMLESCQIARKITTRTDFDSDKTLEDSPAMKISSPTVPKTSTYGVCDEPTEADVSAENIPANESLPVSLSFQSSSSVLINTSSQSLLLTGDKAPVNSDMEMLEATRTAPKCLKTVPLDGSVSVLPDPADSNFVQSQIPHILQIPDNTQHLAHEGTAVTTDFDNGVLQNASLETSTTYHALFEKTGEEIACPEAENLQTTKEDGPTEQNFIVSAPAHTKGSDKLVTDPVTSENIGPGDVRENNCLFDVGPGKQSLDGVLESVQGQALEDVMIKSKGQVATESSTSNENNNCSAVGSTQISRFQKNVDIVDSSSDTGSGETSIISSVSSLVGFRGERKPSSADEETAIASLLSLCTGHPSDDTVPSSSTDQE